MLTKQIPNKMPNAPVAKLRQHVTIHAQPDYNDPNGGFIGGFTTNQPYIRIPISCVQPVYSIKTPNHSKSFYISGSQVPIGYDSWVQFYNYNTVLGAKITVHISKDIDTISKQKLDSGTALYASDLACYLYLDETRDSEPDGTLQYSTRYVPDQLDSRNNCIKRNLRTDCLSTTKGDIVKLVGTYSPRKLHGITDVKDVAGFRNRNVNSVLFQDYNPGSTITPPWASRDSWWQVVVTHQNPQNSSALALPPLKMRVFIEYCVQYHEYRNQSMQDQLVPPELVGGDGPSMKRPRT